MNRRFFKLPESTDPKARSAFIYASVIMASAVLSAAVEVYLAIAKHAWQLWGAAGVATCVFAASHIAHRMIRKGQIERAAQALIYGFLTGVIANTLFIADVSISLALLAVALTIEVASRSTEHPERYVITGFVAGSIAILLDLFLPAYRLVSPELNVFTPVIAGVVVVVLGVLTWRGFRDFRLRTKVIVVILTIVMGSVGIVALLANQSLSSSLAGNVGGNLSALANSKAIEIRETVKREVGLLETLALSRTIQTLVAGASQQVPLTPSEIAQLDKQWRTARENNDLSSQATAILANEASLQLREFEKQFPDHLEVLVTDQQGRIIAEANPSDDYYKGDEEWWQITYRERIWISQPQYDEKTQSTVVVVAMTIREEKSRNVLGIIRTMVRFDSLVPSLATGSFGRTGRIVLYQATQQELALEPGPGNTFTVSQKATEFPVAELVKAIDSRNTFFNITHNKTPVLASQSAVSFGDDVSEDSMAVSKLHWRVIVFEDQTEALQPVQGQTRNIVVLALGIFVVATFAALGLAQIISGPLIRLTALAEKVAAGDLSAQAQVETGDETGALAKTFNSMTAQLRDLIGTLEHRVAERTKALATSAEVSRRLSTILDERQLIGEVVEQLKTAFNYYHVHIYLLDETSGDLNLAGGSGEVGVTLLNRGHKVPKGKGLVGRAATSKAPVHVTDTSQDPGWLPNPLLPETRSEIAVPIATASEVLGVLDVQHDEVNGLKQEDVDLLQSVATQTAIAIENARSYAEAHQMAEREARITDIGQKIQSTTTIESALQVVVRELGRSLGVNSIRAILDASSLGKSDRK